MSSGYEDIWGQSLARIRETYDDGFFDTVHPDDVGEYRTFVEGIVADVEEGTAADRYSQEYRIERPDGEMRWVRSDYYPTGWESGPSRVVIVSRDVTDRKSRERRIASFDDATDDLATADTPEEATRTAVEAATEKLDLPAVGAFLYDDDDGVLRPEVLTGQLPSDLAADPVGPGDGPLWEGFATGTIVASDGGHSETGFVGGGDGSETPGALDDLEEWRGLALGSDSPHRKNGSARRPSGPTASTGSPVSPSRSRPLSPRRRTRVRWNRRCASASPVRVRTSSRGSAASTSGPTDSLLARSSVRRVSTSMRWT